MRLTLDKQLEYVCELLILCTPLLGNELVNALIQADQTNDVGIAAQRERVALLKERLLSVVSGPSSVATGNGQRTTDQIRGALRDLLGLADVLVRKSVWIIGGDGWAYDIGFGGLDHVLASGRNVNVLVLDTEVYSNTGGQASKSTPRGAVAKFAAKGKGTAKKDLGLLAMAYGDVYVARVAMGADDLQTLRAFQEAEAYDGPSMIIAYSHCIAHGIDMRKGLAQQKLAVQAGHWPLYRYNPALAAEGKPALTLDSKAPSIPLEQYTYNETRYRMLQQSDAARAEMLMHEAAQDIQDHWKRYQQLAAATTNGSEDRG
jgi:pyruvate-ferredoxin/flavodoxin oxidoreductase